MGQILAEAKRVSELEPRVENVPRFLYQPLGKWNSLGTEGKIPILEDETLIPRKGENTVTWLEGQVIKTQHPELQREQSGGRAHKRVARRGH